MLCIHMDTVYPKEDAFQVCRMTEGGQLNGPGVADAKGGLVVMLYALKALEQSPLAGKIGWEVIINADEEVGSPGSGKLIRARASHCNFGLLFEPALPGGHLVSWRKGSGDFTFVVRGKSAHSGRDFNQGRNAIVALARLLDEIDKLNGEPDVTLNVGRISGGGALNRVPDLAVGRVNVRVKDLEEQNGVEIDFEDLVKKYSQLDGISVEMHGGFTSPPKPDDDHAIALQQRIAQCGAALGMEFEFKGTGGACDGNKFAAAGLVNVDSMGPCGGNIHSDKEFLIPESLVPRTKLTALTLLSLAVGD
jgi:glutamate carboxypeptidase